MARLKPKYERLLQNYDNETDMCNQLGLNYDEIYDYSTPKKKDEEDFLISIWEQSDAKKR